MKNEVLKVVLHVSNFEQITRMQNNVNNLFKKDDTADVSVVVNGEAVTKFTKGNETKLNPKATYYLCNNSLKSNNILTDDLLTDTHITPSGVYKLALLQREGYLYIKV
ncbi:MAG: hypothetical protein WCY04_04315 [Bacilli bacterium]|jgi:intracellular sulfur oxidation DsrE/DsrF family protein